MKTQDSVDIPDTSPQTGRTKKRTRFATLGALLVVALIVGASAIVFAQLSQQQKHAAQPPSGHWVSVLPGYLISSIIAANTSSQVLYTCPGYAQSGKIISNTLSHTVLRSSDFGTHWQEVGKKAVLGQSCQLAVNPTNGNDIFAIGLPNSTVGNAQLTETLKHSNDSGQTWTTLQPTLTASGSTTPIQWNVQELSFVGNALFGIQWFTANTGHSGIVPKYSTQLPRLVTSSDAGQTWTVVDAQLASAKQGVNSYVVDPANTRTIYELVNSPWRLIQPIVTEPDSIVPMLGVNVELYKTTDGGATWHLLLNNLPFGTHIQLASDNPQILYVGGMHNLIPNVIRPSATNSTVYPIDGFRLQMSRDGGATWRVVPSVPQVSYVQGWFVDNKGQVFINASNGHGYGGGGLPPTGTAQPMASIQRYDPINNTWSEVTKPPTFGVLLAVTPGDVLWFLSTPSDNGQNVLYRFVV